ncbi:hypothetical protein NCC49_005645 [Naganishia albida]|nr:hypothetical protein NCC49_005645 [Naganishia albida]
MTSRNMHVPMPSPPDLSTSTGTPTPGTSTVVTPSIVLPPELRPLTNKTSPDSGRATPSNAPDLDLSLPLSTLLRESTKIAHTQAEHSPGAIALAGGTLPFREYVRYLASLWIVYTVLEREIGRHATSTDGEAEKDVLGSLWNEQRGGKGRMLSRSEALAQDVAYLVSLKPASEWTIDARDTALLPSTSAAIIPTPTFPVPPFLEPLFTSPPDAITQFASHLTEISATRPALLLAHAYVRYLGDLSGGQIVRSRIRRVYTLDPPNTSDTAPEHAQDGTQFYEFDIFDSSDRPPSAEGHVVQPSMYERKQRMADIKDWFRSVLDSGTADGAEDLKRALVDEAIESFHLSTHIFSALRPDAAPSSSAPAETAPARRQFVPEKRTSIVTWQWLGLLALYVAWMAYRYVS